MQRAQISLLLASLTVSACSAEVIDAPKGTDGVGTSASSQMIYGTQDQMSTFEMADGHGMLGEGDLTVLMVVDRSGSMAAPWDGSTKWQIARSSLDAAIVGVEDQVTIGALFFPMGDDCGVLPFSDPSHIHFQKGALFQKELSDFSQELGGGTPLYAALLHADDAVNQAVMDGALERRLRVVVVTDGEPNCSGTEEEMVEVTDGWREMGVDVRVMGLPGSETAARFLDRLAGKEVSETDPYVAPPTVVNTETSAEDTGYVAPSNSDDVDDSLHVVVR